jgi:hypothetical protein
VVEDAVQFCNEMMLACCSFLAAAAVRCAALYGALEGRRESTPVG